MKIGGYCPHCLQAIEDCTCCGGTVKISVEKSYNVFDGAVFGDKFSTRDGRTALLLDEKYIMGQTTLVNIGVINKVGTFIQYTVNPHNGVLVQDGEEFTAYPCPLDIVERIQ